MPVRIIGILFTFLFTASVSFAQQNLVATGGTITGAGGSVSTSVGQIDHQVLSGSGASARQGVQQPVVPDHMWMGTVSTDWADADNWSKGEVPGTSDEALITQYPTNQPLVFGTPASPTMAGDVLVRTGAILTVGAGKAMTLNGSLDNDGTILVKADASGIGSFIDNGTITGSGAFQMEQYLTGAGGGTPNGLFYYVSPPVSGATASTFDVASGNKAWSADEATQSYTQLTNGAMALNAREGYVARMGSTGVVTYSGSGFNTGDQDASGLTRTGTTEPSRGYSLLGNPYPSTVSWDDADRTNLMSTMWYRTHQGSTMLYDTYNATGMIGTNNNGGGAVTGDIPPGQAFWVRVPVDGQTGELSFTNAMRSHGTQTSIYKTEQQNGVVRMSISNGTLSDETIVMFDASAMDEFDDFDSQKYWAGSSLPQLYTNIQADTLVINGLYSTVTNPVVDMGMKLPSAGDYTISASDITLSEDVYLEDRELGIFQHLNVEPEYLFTSTISGNIPTRFALHFGLSVTDVDEKDNAAFVYASAQQIHVVVSDDVQQGQIQLLDMSGRIVQTAALNGKRTVVTTNIPTGIYLVRLETESQTQTDRVFINR